MTRPVPEDERKFLEGYDPTAFDRPSVAVDAVVFTVDEKQLRAVVVKRADHPFREAWALPGGFVGIDETLEAAVERSLANKAGLTLDHLEQLYTFGDPGRDPRLRVISVAWLAVCRPDRLSDLPEGVRTAAVQVDWPGEEGGPARVVDDEGAVLPLSFDHADILGKAVQRVRGKLSWTDLAFSFLPDRFTLRDLRLVFETLLDRSLNKDSFRRTVLSPPPAGRHGHPAAQRGPPARLAVHPRAPRRALGARRTPHLRSPRGDRSLRGPRRASGRVWADILEVSYG